MRRAARIGVALALIASGSAAASAQARLPRLQGTFSLRGTLTTADNVFGEHLGQRVQRTWVFRPRCATRSCRRVTLRRQRSGKHIPDVVTLVRRRADLYVGRGSFWVALRCAGQVLTHGGLATETITVRITRTTMVGTTPFATAISARYNNPSRHNLTRCPGGIGHDAASYRGQRTTPLPAPPIASFTSSPNLVTTSASFSDHSAPGSGGEAIVAWSWNFGDPASATDTSAQRNPTHRFSAPGTYTVTLRVRDRWGQTATHAAQVTV